MKLLKAAALVAALSALTGCAGLAFMGAPGASALYADVTYGGIATNNSVGGKTSNPACASSILGILVTGDSSIGTAAKQAGITKVATVDMQFSNLLGLFAKSCTIVTGE